VCGYVNEAIAHVMEKRSHINKDDMVTGINNDNVNKRKSVILK